MNHVCEQEQSINDIDKTIHNLESSVAKQSGWFKTSAWVIGIATLSIGGLSGIILGKLSAIEALLTSSQVVQGRLEEKFNAIDRRVSDIERKHETLDQLIGKRSQ